MNDNDLIQALRRARSLPPPAPRDEWGQILEKAQAPSFWQRLFQPWPTFALGGAMALLLAALCVPLPDDAETAALESFLADSSSELAFSNASLSSSAPGAAYLELLEQLP